MRIVVTSEPRIDGRVERGRNTRTNILISCRYLMGAGNFRPTMEQCCKDARHSYRAGHHHFGTTEALHQEALDDEETQHEIAWRVIGAELPTLWPETVRRVARAAVLGKI